MVIRSKNRVSFIRLWEGLSNNIFITKHTKLLSKLIALCIKIIIVRFPSKCSVCRSYNKKKMISRLPFFTQLIKTRLRLPPRSWNVQCPLKHFLKKTFRHKSFSTNNGLLHRFPEKPSFLRQNWRSASKPTRIKKK